MQRLTILIYHRVFARPDPLFPDVPDAEAFDRQLGVLQRMFDVLPLGEAAARLRDGRLRRPAACVTFDDGYADNAEVALPVLANRGLRATVFVSTGFLGDGCMFNDRVIEAVRNAPAGRADLADLGLGTPTIDGAASRRGLIDELLERLKYLPQDRRLETADALAARLGTPAPRPMMSADQVRQLHRAGIEIGAHTVTHPILANTEAGVAAREIGESRETLESLIGARVGVFAYPNGRPNRDYTREHVEMVRRAGFDCAVSTALGVATPASDPFQLPRLQPWPRKTSRLALELARNLLRTRAEAA